MIAVDTNVAVRMLMRDDERQWAVADRVFRTSRLWLATTVLLEVEWVLRGGFGLEAKEIAGALRGMCKLENVSLENAEAFDAALDALESGLDFADALHAATSASSGVERLVTFDKAFAARAGRCRTGLAVELIR
jgi:predicted nucleic-acid-binding protein